MRLPPPPTLETAMTMTRDTASPASPDGAFGRDDSLGDDRLLELEVLEQDRRDELLHIDKRIVRTVQEETGVED
jgi:hypothetical protein